MPEMPHSQGLPFGIRDPELGQVLVEIRAQAAEKLRDRLLPRQAPHDHVPHRDQAVAEPIEALARGNVALLDEQQRLAGNVPGRGPDRDRHGNAGAVASDLVQLRLPAHDVTAAEQSQGFAEDSAVLLGSDRLQGQLQELFLRPAEDRPEPFVDLDPPPFAVDERQADHRRFEHQAQAFLAGRDLFCLSLSLVSRRPDLPDHLGDRHGGDQQHDRE